ncbi:mitochondrial import receptor subunit TOM40 homolog 1-like [Scaptodrosophila lebanonensis]|uniref:Mitochondrial import receptor subunit TOM40 homolog 1-like n=1 Tax=Drosophila lebanonensis TaxID=7225 RepID=A0A6J2U0H2_DROLE|nr:mitochondrial import receptor subunit TOM40 homolog 1-like [Scaptodrosophila lebanonensis]
MGNVLASQPYSQEDRDKLFRLFGIRMANEGDDNTLPTGRGTQKYSKASDRRMEIKLDRLNEQARIEEYPEGKKSIEPQLQLSVPYPTAIPATSNNNNNNNSSGSSSISSSNSGSNTITAINMGDQAMQQNEPDPERQNPGCVGDIHRKCRDVQPTPFEGLKFIVNKTVNNNFFIGHTLQLGKPQNSKYFFNATYAGKGAAAFTKESYPMLTGEMDTAGNLTATLLNYLTPRLRTKLRAAIIESKLVDANFSVDYMGDDFTCSCVVSNIDFKRRTGLAVASYLQEIVPKLAIGLELVYQSEDCVPGGEVAAISGLARYENGSRLWSGMINVNSLEMCYTQSYGESLKASVHMHANILKRQAITRLCYQCDIPKGHFTFRGSVDTRGVISGVCEKRLVPMPMLLVLSGKLNHLSSHFRFGVGVVLD